MPLIGSRMTCSETGRIGEFIARTAFSGYTCRDRETGEYFIIRKSVRGVRKMAKKLRQSKARKPNNRPRLRKGQRVLLRLPEVDKPVPAKYLGRGLFVGVDDPVWQGCKLDERDGLEVIA